MSPKGYAKALRCVRRYATMHLFTAVIIIMWWQRRTYLCGRAACSSFITFPSTGVCHASCLSRIIRGVLLYTCIVLCRYLHDVRDADEHLVGDADSSRPQSSLPQRVSPHSALVEVRRLGRPRSSLVHVFDGARDHLPSGPAQVVCLHPQRLHLLGI